MKKNLIISSVAAIAALNPEGFTVNAATLQPVSKGFAVALKQTQNSFGAATAGNVPFWDAGTDTLQRTIISDV